MEISLQEYVLGGSGDLVNNRKVLRVVTMENRLDIAI